MTIRVMLADDHTLVRQALQKALDAEPDIEVVAGTGSGAETLAVLGDARPDILVLDIGLPDINGIELARKLAHGHDPVRIVALSGYADPFYVEEMLKAGAQAYVIKSAGTEELLAAIRAVAGGHNYVSAEVTRILVNRVTNDPPQGTVPLGRLGRREREVLKLLAEGKRAPDIALCLGITISTAEAHRRNIKQKLGLYTTAELTRYAIREGLVTP
ncbi:MAG: response regulator [Actinomycetota bacterium]